MAAPNLSSRKRREMLYQQRPDQAKLNQAAESELEAGRLYLAVELFHRAGSDQRIQEVAALAVEQGDLFVYLESLRVLGRDGEADELRKLAQVAEGKGLSRFAARAKSLAEVEEADA